MAMTRLDSDERRKAIVSGGAAVRTQGLRRNDDARARRSRQHIRGAAVQAFPEQETALPGNPAPRLRGRSGAGKTRHARAVDADARLHGPLYMVRLFSAGDEADAPNSTRGCGCCCTAFSKTAITRASCSRRSPRGWFRCSRPRSRQRPRRAIAPAATRSANIFWFAHHVAAMMAFASLPTRAASLTRDLDDTRRGGELLHPARDRHERRGDRGRLARGSRAGSQSAALTGSVMDGDQMAISRRGLSPRRRARARRRWRDRRSRGRISVRWFVIVGAAAGVVLGGLYGFNRFRARRSRNFFAHNKPPPAQISAVDGQQRDGAAFRHRHRLARRGASGDDHPRSRRPGHRDPFRAGRQGQGRRSAGATQRRARSRRPRQLPGAGPLAQITLQRNSGIAQEQFRSQETVDQNQSQLDEARAQIHKTEAIIAQKLIRAPFAGQLGVRQIDLGQYLSPGTPIVTLTDLKTLYVNFTLPTQTRRDRGRTEVDVTADAFPGRIFTAKITTIEPQISADTRTMKVQATMTNPDEALLPGMFVNAAVVLPPRARHGRPARDRGRLHALWRQRLCGPRRRQGRRRAADAARRSARRSRPGMRWDDKVAILDGVKPGERVVAAGQIKLQDGVAGRRHRQLRRRSRPQHPDAKLDRSARIELMSFHRHLHPPAGAGAGRQPADPADRAARDARACRSGNIRKLSNTTITVTTIYPGAVARSDRRALSRRRSSRRSRPPRASTT